MADSDALAVLVSASGKVPLVLASPTRGAAASGELDASTGQITFDAALKSGDKIFFLEPVTYIPLVKPAILQ